MFESAWPIKIRHHEREQVSGRERLVLWVVIGVVSIVVFGGRYAAVQMLE
jgi:lipid-A-disaccharide synthase-like uncharacterized protein